MPGTPLHNEEQHVNLEMDQSGNDESDSAQVTALQDHVEPISHSLDLGFKVTTLLKCKIWAIIIDLSCKNEGLVRQIGYWNEIKYGNKDCGKHELGIVFLIKHLESSGEQEDEECNASQAECMYDFQFLNRKRIFIYFMSILTIFDMFLEFLRIKVGPADHTLDEIDYGEEEHVPACPSNYLEEL